MRRLVSTVAAASLLAGCASGVTQRPRSASDGAERTLALADARVARVSFKLSAEAQQMAAKNPVFDAAVLQTKLERHLAERRLLASTARQTLEVELIDLRARSAGAAFLGGVLAGPDHLIGTVTVRSPDGRVLKKYDVSASYWLGGVAGSQDMRMGWLYNQFAQHTADALLGAAPAVN